jgi:PAS domain S-box-containing protein
MKEKNETILVIEKNFSTSETMEQALSGSGYKIIKTSEVDQLDNLAKKNQINIVIVDTGLLTTADITFTLQKSLEKNSLPVVFIYSTENPGEVEKTRDITSYGYVMKNTEDIVLLSTVQTALKLHELYRTARAQLEEIEASNEELQAAMEELEAINNELMTAQKNLADSEGKYRRLHESVMDAVIMIDNKGKIIEANKAFQDLTGYTGQELLQMGYYDITPEKWESFENNIYRQQLKPMGYTEIYEKEFIVKNGDTIPVEMRAYVYKDEEGNKAGSWAIVRDITERKKAEQALIKSENLLRNFLEEVMEGIAILNAEGAVTFWNNVCTVMTGITAEEAMGKYWWDLAFKLEPEETKTDEQLAKMKKLFRRIAASDFKKYTNPLEITIRRIDGSEALFERRIFPVNTMEGIQYAVTILDITEKKYAELLKENALKELEKSETRFRSIIQGSSDMIFILDRSGFFTYESPSVSLISGFPPGYFIGKSPFTHIHPDDYKAVYGKINQIEQGEHTGTPAEFRCRKSDGSWAFLELLGNNQYNNPSINGIVLTVRDISERKRSEIALRNSENLFKTLLNTTPAGVALLKDRIFQKVNNALCKITGYSEDELVGKPTRILYFDNEEYNHVGKKLYDFKKENTAEMLEARLCKKDGTAIDVLLSQSPFDIKDINAGVCTTVLDITEQKRVVNALRESESELKSLLDSAPIGIGMIRERKFIKVNKALCSITGYSENELLNELTRIIYPSDEVFEKIGSELYEKMKKNGIGIMETYFLTKDGRILDILLTLIPFDENDLSLGQCATALDITERNRMEREIRESEEKYRSIYENMPIGFIRSLLDGSIIDINPAAIQMFGYRDRTEAIDLTSDDKIGLHISVEDRNNIIQDMINHTGIKKYTMQMKKKDGNLFTASLIMKMIRSENGEPLFIEGLIEDITERVKMQDILIQSEKMMTVAGLAAGMAHEINNPLGIIMQNAENAMHRLFDKLPGNIKAAEEAGITLEQLITYVAQRRIDNYLEAIREAGNRAARIVSSMLQFSRISESRITYMNINILIDNALELASNDFDLRKKYDFKRIVINKNYGQIPDIPCVETQIEQVLLNIFKNSAQAMHSVKTESDKTPEISITTLEVENAVRVEIKDNGPGMDDATRKRIFEPFFTTKQTGSGTGLGLSVSYYIIVNGHNGSIWVDSAPETGTKITITLPLIKKDNKNGPAHSYH